MVRISRKKNGIVYAAIRSAAERRGWSGGCAAGWMTTLIFLPIMLVLAVLFYSGLSLESSISIARGYVFVSQRKIRDGGGTQMFAEATFKPKGIKVEGNAVLVFSRWTQLRIVFQDDALKEPFVLEVSNLVKPREPMMG